MDLNAFLAFVRQWGIPGGIGTALGGLATHFIESYRGRVQEIEYNVTHNRLGLSTDDTTHGPIQITWRGRNLNNLYVSTVTVSNTTAQDYKDLTLAVWSEDPTFLLSETTETAGTTFRPEPRKEYLERITAGEGAEVTEEQLLLFQHRREYTIPVLNRGDKAIFRYLSTVPTNVRPIMWVNTLQPGLKAKYHTDEATFWGLPLSPGLVCGLLVCPLILFVLRYTVSGWWAVSIAMVCGLCVIPIGGLIYRFLRGVKRIVLH